MLGCCSFDAKFDTKANLVKEYAHWLLLVRVNHSKLGACVAVTKRHLERFSDLTREEMADFHAVVQDAEHALRSAFGYEKINYLMLMMVDAHTHFHLFPRYTTPRHFAGRTWTDDGQPDPLLQRAEDVSGDTLRAIRDELRKQLQHG